MSPLRPSSRRSIAGSASRQDRGATTRSRRALPATPCGPNCMDVSARAASPATLNATRHCSASIRVRSPCREWVGVRASSPIGYSGGMHSVRLAALLGAVLATAGVAAAERQTANVVLITLDGVRIEEIFGGLDEVVARSIVKKGAPEDSALWQRYWAPTAAERRRTLMPFLWGTILADHGTIVGNQAAGCVMQGTSRH